MVFCVAEESSLMLLDNEPCKTGGCGKFVIRYDRENHAPGAHKGKGVKWMKLG